MRQTSRQRIGVVNYTMCILVLCEYNPGDAFLMEIHFIVMTSVKAIAYDIPYYAIKSNSKQSVDCFLQSWSK